MLTAKVAKASNFIFMMQRSLSIVAQIDNRVGASGTRLGKGQVLYFIMRIVLTGRNALNWANIQA